MICAGKRIVELVVSGSGYRSGEGWSAGEEGDGAVDEGEGEGWSARGGRMGDEGWDKDLWVA